MQVIVTFIKAIKHRQQIISIHKFPGHNSRKPKTFNKPVHEPRTKVLFPVPAANTYRNWHGCRERELLSLSDHLQH